MKLILSLLASCLAATAPTVSSAVIFNTVLHTGDPAPGIAGATINDVNFPVINSAGQVAFRAVTNTGLDVIYFGDPNMLTPVAIEGDAAFGGPATFSGFDARLILTDDGQIFFQGDLTGTGITAANNRFFAVAPPVVAGVAGTPLKIAQEGDALPNTTFSIRADSFAPGPNGPELFAQSGPLAAFRTTLNDSAAPGTIREGILAFDLPNGLHPVVVSGDAAPDGLGVFGPPPGGFGPVFDIAGLGPGGFIAFGGVGTDGVTPFNGIFDHFPSPDAVGGGDPLTTRILAGDRAPGTKPQRGFFDFNEVGMADGGLLIFQSILQNNTTLEVLFNEIGLFTDLGPEGPVRLLAGRDKPAPGAGPGVVFSAFFSSAINEAGDTVFEAALFKRPNGIAPPKDMGTFASQKGKRRKLLIGGQFLVDDQGTAYDLQAAGFPSTNFGAQSAALAALIEADVQPIPQSVNALVHSNFTGPKPIHTITAVEGKLIETTTGPKTVTSLAAPTTPMGSAGQPRIANENGEMALEIGDSGGAGIYVGDVDGDTPPRLQPDIYLGSPKKIGDGVHQNKPADPQIQSREVTNNTEETIIFFVQNDGSVTDTINFTSSGKDAGGRIRWFAGDDQSVEITDAVLGEGKAFTLKPGETQKLRLVVKHVNLANKSRDDKVKMKAVSADPKKPRDTFQFTVKFRP